MNSEKARSLFDLAVDEGLASSERVEFEQALAADADLRLDYERHQRMVASTRALGSEEAAPVDLLAGVHQRIHDRSGGRFYADRFARSAGSGPKSVLLVSVAALALALCVFWVRCTPVEPVNPSSQGPAITID